MRVLFTAKNVLHFLDSSYVHKLMLFGTICIRSHELPDEMGDSVQLRHFGDVLLQELYYSPRAGATNAFLMLLMTESQ